MVISQIKKLFVPFMELDLHMWTYNENLNQKVKFFFRNKGISYRKTRGPKKDKLYKWNYNLLKKDCLWL